MILNKLILIDHDIEVWEQYVAATFTILQFCIYNIAISEILIQYLCAVWIYFS